MSRYDTLGSNTDDLTLPEMIRQAVAWDWRRTLGPDTPWWMRKPFLAGVAFAVPVAVVFFVVWLVAELIGGVVEVLLGWAADGAEWVTGTEVVGMITDAVHAYLTEHSTGLPLSTSGLWWGWWSLVAALWLLAWMGNRGAQLGWLLVGAAAAYMVWSSTAEQARPVATATVAAMWVLMSLFALRRVRRDGTTVVVPGQPVR
ncbi:hypothetical protein [Catellatospora citrea]|uniref:Uncharacterized protein n=1 Tax=Catellatospora citrea TaxID=53366 RepID=A0A8J3P3V8_9ACTN|nr:hypothetical protein [Catellatospora citrea]RKE13013.1 hypothetical protein C8E86_7958 [Catellatospora citrea]GIG03228.1 hypothetical protein Cci01nite_83210 [Catellatospora citrea]